MLRALLCWAMPGTLIIGDTWMVESVSRSQELTPHKNVIKANSSSVFDFTLGAAKAEANARLRPSLNIVLETALVVQPEMLMISILKRSKSSRRRWFQSGFLVGEMTPRLGPVGGGTIRGIYRANCLPRWAEKLRLPFTGFSLVRAATRAGTLSAPSQLCNFRSTTLHV